MKTFIAAIAFLCSMTVVAAHKHKHYKRCRCMTKNIRGIATGDKNDVATGASCTRYKEIHADQGSWLMQGTEWCTYQYGKLLDGDDWWNLCTQQPGAAAGQCEPFGGSLKG
ncbi:hypothetical protein EJ03DRAFT_384482 [Teratosphaeria nubilosa]|uniref:Uncharacterized protein n=1 Tax=Teratosphaeria nubilosa TaxID=161662 RepID=A0A6G1L1G4_9PEZI|nr:hypothetical protein EJ03DRAFT_384482 [Teratosphaeria nubilosa]